MASNENLDIELLRSFAAIAETGSFTRTAERLSRTQSTISLQVKRLEEVVGRRLLERNARRVRLTDEGETVLGFARRILRLNDECLDRLGEPELAGRVRLGTPEDFATAHLPGVLAAFAQHHPRVALEVTCDLTLNLLERFRAGEFDLVLLKREPQGPSAGVLVWRETLVWAGRDGFALTDEEPVPLVASPYPCVYRKRAVTALDGIGRAWRAAYTSTSLAGTQAAVLAGLGVTVLPRDMVPRRLRVLGQDSGMPALDDTEIALYRAAGALPRTAERLAEHMVRSLETASRLDRGIVEALPV